MAISRWISRTSFVFLCTALLGCGAAGEMATEQSSAEQLEKAASSTKPQNDATTAPPIDAAQDRKDARVSFVRREQGATRFPGTKLNESIYEYKLYSDDSKELDGKYAEFWSDGSSKFVDGEYKDNLRSGTRRYYHDNGELAREVRFVDGQLDGSWTRFRRDGSKEMEVSYKNGKRDGLWKSYALVEADKSKDNNESPGAAKDNSKEKSKESSKTDVAKPQSKATETKANEKKGPPAVRLAFEGAYKNGLRDGLWITYHPNGQKAAESNIKDDRREGKETTWYASGKKMLEADYKNGVLDGVATMWNEQGDVVLRREYKEGKLVPKSAKTTEQAAK